MPKLEPEKPQTIVVAFRMPRELWTRIRKIAAADERTCAAVINRTLRAALEPKK